MKIIESFLIILSAIVLVSGLINGNLTLEISGSVIFLLSHLLALPMEYKKAKLYREGKWSPNETRTILDIVTKYFGYVMVALGLVLFFLKHASGIIIFGGAVIIYLISGWIARDVAGIPLEMRYGVWQKKNYKRRHSPKN